ncbi:MAG: hypothetical protein A4S09_04765 [Proteobacteria bacterium SG_bin7]|nr:MAG: hypothetical protein A4S09_04765 [Proteobacteria bacterium SG_bin7]
MVSALWFQRLTVGVILFSAFLLGFETNRDLMAVHGATLKLIDRGVVVFFVIEIILKFVAQGKTPLKYFSDTWNTLDFIIVAGCLIPSGSNALAIFRMIRVLRIFRLVTALPKLQIIISALFKSIPSMGYVVVLLGMHFYMFGVLGSFLFSNNDPIHFGSLGKSFLTLFQVLTLEGWVDVMRIQIYGCADFGYESFPDLCTASQRQPFAAALFFISFIIIGTMFILNLLIGAVVNGMSESQREVESGQTPSADQSLALTALTAEIRRLREKIESS